MAQGRKGERVIFSRGFSMLDPRNPQTQNMMRMGPLPGMYIAAAYGTEPSKLYQAFSNYLLDQTAITDTRTGEQGTVSNAYAHSLLQHNSNFQEVPTEDLIKDVTY